MHAFLASALWAALPPITTPAEAVTQIRAAQASEEVLAHVRDACKGKYRRALRDAPELKAEVLGRLEKAPRAMLDLHPCFSNDTVVGMIERALGLGDEAVAHAAEVAARIEAPNAVPLLLDALEKRKARCLAPNLEGPALDACVWLTYAPSAAVAKADAATKRRAFALAKAMQEAPYPKMKEVSAETIKASKR